MTANIGCPYGVTTEHQLCFQFTDDHRIEPRVIPDMEWSDDHGMENELKKHLLAAKI